LYHFNYTVRLLAVILLINYSDSVINIMKLKIHIQIEVEFEIIGNILFLEII